MAILAKRTAIVEAKQVPASNSFDTAPLWWAEMQKVATWSGGTAKVDPTESNCIEITNAAGLVASAYEEDWILRENDGDLSILESDELDNGYRLISD